MLGSHILGSSFANDINLKVIGLNFYQNIFEAIYSKYNNSAIDMNGFYYNIAPKKTKMNYGIYFLVNNNSEYTFSENLEDTLIQFNIFSKSSTEIFKIVSEFKKLYDWGELTIDNYNSIYCKRESDVVFQDGNTYQASITYRILTEEK